METHYEINVSELANSGMGTGPYYRHLFATHERSCVSEERMRDVLKAIKERFSEPEFKITVTLYECKGLILDEKELAAMQKEKKKKKK